MITMITDHHRANNRKGGRSTYIIPGVEKPVESCICHLKFRNEPKSFSTASMQHRLVGLGNLSGVGAAER